MSRPSRIKQLYHEIRESLGSEISSKEALQLAAHLVDVADGRDVIPFDTFRDQRATFEELPVDEAIADGGWRVLNREKDIVRSLFGSDEPSYRRKPRYQVIDLELAA
jgi:hypothetical protein